MGSTPTRSTPDFGRTPAKKGAPSSGVVHGGVVKRRLSSVAMSESQTVEADVFVEQMAPTVAALHDFTTAVDDVAVRHADVPATDSQAMRELAAENDYRSQSSWQNPITDTHMFGGATLRAASDYVRTFATAFTAERPPTVRSPDVGSIRA